MGQASLSHVQARARHREQVARFIAEHGVRWRSPVPSEILPLHPEHGTSGWSIVAETEPACSGSAYTKPRARAAAIRVATRQLSLQQRHFDVHAARTAAEDMLAKAEADLVEIEMFKDWTRTQKSADTLPVFTRQGWRCSKCKAAMRKGDAWGDCRVCGSDGGWTEAEICDGWPGKLARKYARKRCPNRCVAVQEIESTEPHADHLDQIARALLRSNDQHTRLLASAWTRDPQPVPSAWRGERQWVAEIPRRPTAMPVPGQAAVAYSTICELVFDTREAESLNGRRTTVLAPRPLSETQREQLAEWLLRQSGEVSRAYTVTLGRRTRVYGDDHRECTTCKRGWVPIFNRRSDIVTAPARVRLARRVLAALGGQPSECNGCDGKAKRWAPRSGPVPCPDCRGTGHNLRGTLPPLRPTPPLRRRRADQGLDEDGVRVDETWLDDPALVGEMAPGWALLSKPMRESSVGLDRLFRIERELAEGKELAERETIAWPETRVVPRGEHRPMETAHGASLDARITARGLRRDGFPKRGCPPEVCSEQYPRRPRWRRGELRHAKLRAARRLWQATQETERQAEAAGWVRPTGDQHIGTAVHDDGAVTVLFGDED